LLVGAPVTLLGELHRDADGLLTLRPWQGHTGGNEEPSGAVTTEYRRTSRERCAVPAPTSSALQPEAASSQMRSGNAAQSEPMLTGKVLVSDDPELLIVADEAAGTAVPPAPRSGCCRWRRTASANYLCNAGAAQFPAPPG
jgi:hypothetical protein